MASGTPGYVVLSVAPADRVLDGNEVVITASFFTLADVPVDPTAATLAYELSGVATSVGPTALTKATVGVWAITVDTTGFCASVGQQYVTAVCEVAGTGTCQCAGTISFQIDAEPF